MASRRGRKRPALPRGPRPPAGARTPTAAAAAARSAGGAGGGAGAVGAAPRMGAPNTLEGRLDSLVNDLYVLGLMVDDFYENTQEKVLERVNGLVAHLQEVDRLKDATGDASVPIDLLRLMDKPSGNNPDLFLKRELDRVLTARKEAQLQRNSLQLLHGGLGGAADATSTTTGAAPTTAPT